MNAFWNKKQEESRKPVWTAEATAGIEQALSQAPVPKVLKGRVKRELESAAEAAARDAGHEKVELEDVMKGMLAKMPANMRDQVEQAMKGGPEALKNLEKKFRGK